MIYGYARISRRSQNIERQIRNIIAMYPDAIIYEEAFTGTKVEGRKEFNKLINRVKEKDTIVFDSVSRMSRNADEGIDLYMNLFNRGVELVFLKEPQINTVTYKKALDSVIELTGTNLDYILKGINKYLMSLAKEQIRLAFEQSQKEVEDLHQRTREGMQIGQKPGAKLTTKKSVEMKIKIQKMSKDFTGNMTDKEIIETLKIARNTYYKYKKELQGGN